MRHNPYFGFEPESMMWPRQCWSATLISNQFTTVARWSLGNQMDKAHLSGVYHTSKVSAWQWRNAIHSLVFKDFFQQYNYSILELETANQSLISQWLMSEVFSFVYFINLHFIKDIWGLCICWFINVSTDSGNRGIESGTRIWKYKSPKKDLTEYVFFNSCTHPSQLNREHHCLSVYLPMSKRAWFG